MQRKSGLVGKIVLGTLLLGSTLIPLESKVDFIPANPSEEIPIVKTLNLGGISNIVDVHFDEKGSPDYFIVERPDINFIYSTGSPQFNKYLKAYNRTLAGKNK